MSDKEFPRVTCRKCGSDNIDLVSGVFCLNCGHHSAATPKVVLRNTMDMPLPRPWWSGDPRVEPYMAPVATALDNNGIKAQARTEIYNRAYEAVYNAIKDRDPR